MFKYLKEIKLTQDRFFLTLLIFAICERTIFVFPILFACRIIGAESLYDFFVNIIYIVLIFGSISQKRLSYISPATIVLVFFVFFSIVLTYVNFPENFQYLKEGWHLGLKSVVPWLLLGTCFYSDKISSETIGKWCTFGVLFMSAYLLIFNNQLDETGGGYDMDASYRLLLSTLITINYAFYSRNKWAIGASLVGIIYAFAMGTRGPVVVILVFIMILIAQRLITKGTNKFVMFFVLGVGIAIFVSIGTTPILIYLQETFSNAGFSTRVIDKALMEEAFDDSSREIIRQTLMTDLRNNPEPHGLYSEKSFGFHSAHNLYVEILYYYGYFMGAIIILTLITLPIVAYRKSFNPIAKQWIIMLACLVFLHGIWGGRFLSYDTFFFIGFCIKEIQLSNRTKCITKTNENE